MGSTFVDFSIITPSLNMLSYLKRCHASIADQKDAVSEHIVVDGDSSDGTVEWLAQNGQIISNVQNDNGMYDAINRGLRLAKGEIISYLNCDEQYLPGALSFVKEFFAGHPETDIIFGDPLLVRPNGSLLAYRKGYQPRWFYILASHLYLFSCTMFLRRRIIDTGFQFDAHLKSSGDRDFVVRVLRYGYRAMHVKRYLAVFTVTGKNMGTSQNALLEKRRVMKAAPTWIKILRWPLNVMRLAEKLASGAYLQKMPLEYSIYDSADAVTRKAFRATKASFRWPAE
jgi:glycosyltransferase involved in cell wall biosynthesis